MQGYQPSMPPLPLQGTWARVTLLFPLPLFKYEFYFTPSLLLGPPPLHNCHAAGYPPS